MKNKLFSLGVLGGVVLAVALILGGIYLGMDTNQVQGSVTVGNEYVSTTTRSHLGIELTNLTVLKPGPGSLARVTITGANTGVINFYDATTTDITKTTRGATTTLTSFPASTAANSYDFDLTFNYGLIFEEIGSVATATIMWR